jgi:hypothetical protein
MREERTIPQQRLLRVSAARDTRQGGTADTWAVRISTIGPNQLRLSSTSVLQSHEGEKERELKLQPGFHRRLRTSGLSLKSTTRKSTHIDIPGRILVRLIGRIDSANNGYKTPAIRTRLCLSRRRLLWGCLF